MYACIYARYAKVKITYGRARYGTISSKCCSCVHVLIRPAICMKCWMWGFVVGTRAIQNKSKSVTTSYHQIDNLCWWTVRSRSATERQKDHECARTHPPSDCLLGMAENAGRPTSSGLDIGWRGDAVWHGSGDDSGSGWSRALECS
jgi:hypothetical protein